MDTDDVPGAKLRDVCFEKLVVIYRWAAGSLKMIVMWFCIFSLQCRHSTRDCQRQHTLQGDF